jgi:peptidoglycan/LPS O-acetylase OafA/YrhL
MILAIVAVVCLNSPMDESVWYYTFFSGNISFALGIGLIPLFHYWSLGVEEQYYLWYPWVVKYNKERVSKVVIALCVIWFGLKMGSYVFLGKGLVYKIFSITRFDCMMIGAIGAILYYKKAAWFMRMCANRVVVILTWVLFFSSGLYAQYIPAPIRAEYISIVSLLVIMAGLVSKPLLENRVMNYLGKISYGIYVIHPLLIFVGSWVVKSTGMLSNTLGGGHWIVFASVSALTILLASLSYKYLEMPFLRLKDKFSVVKSTNEKMV